MAKYMVDGEELDLEIPEVEPMEPTIWDRYRDLLEKVYLRASQRLQELEELENRKREANNEVQGEAFSDIDLRPELTEAEKAELEATTEAQKKEDADLTAEFQALVAASEDKDNAFLKAMHYLIAASK